MLRLFLGLILALVGLWIAALVLGLVISLNGRDAWRHTHTLLGFAVGLATIVIQQVAILSLHLASRRIERLVREHGLPEWLGAIAVRNRDRAIPFVMLTLPLIFLVWSLGALLAPRMMLSDLGRAAAGPWSPHPLWHLGFAAVTVGFLPGALLVAYVSVAAQVRLLREVRDLANKAAGEAVPSLPET